MAATPASKPHSESGSHHVTTHNDYRGGWTVQRACRLSAGPNPNPDHKSDLALTLTTAEAELCNILTVALILTLRLRLQRLNASDKLSCSTPSHPKRQFLNPVQRTAIINQV